MGDLAAEIMAGCRLMWPGVGRRWRPVWLPGFVSAANLRLVGGAGGAPAGPEAGAGGVAKATSRAWRPPRLAAPDGPAQTRPGLGIQPGPVRHRSPPRLTAGPGSAFGRPGRGSPPSAGASAALVRTWPA